MPSEDEITEYWKKVEQEREQNRLEGRGGRRGRGGRGRRGAPRGRRDEDGEHTEGKDGERLQVG